MLYHCCRCLHRTTIYVFNAGHGGNKKISFKLASCNHVGLLIWLEKRFCSSGSMHQEVIGTDESFHKLDPSPFSHLISLWFSILLNDWIEICTFVTCAILCILFAWVHVSVMHKMVVVYLHNLSCISCIHVPTGQHYMTWFSLCSRLI
jgi:hypothetical protein